MNYSELQTAILSDSHRPDLADDVPRFIRECEGMIRRELRAFVVSTTLGESDRVDGGVYTLPSTLLEIRSLNVSGEDGDGLSKVSPTALRRLASSAPPRTYAVRGEGSIEIRGAPATDTELDLLYLGHPAALEDDADTNDLLDLHEALYIEGSLFYLFKHTQDVELAQGALDTFGNVVEKLNEQFGRKLGGAAQAGGYNFGGGGGY